jgi:SRSO17 transposase
MSEDRQERFAAYVAALAEVIGHADRVAPLRDYCLGLLLPGERKSVEPIAAVTAPARVSAKHQSLLHFVANAPWSNERVLSRVQELTLPIIEGSGAIEAWIIDDTGFPKKGRHSVGVARQYCGQLGKQDNCQVAVSLSLANQAVSLPVAWRLYLPLEWTADAERRAAAGIPETVGFLTKPEIALEQIRAACAAGLPRGVVLMDAGYGSNTRRREEIDALGLAYIAGIPPQTSVWPPGTAPLPPLPWSGRGRRPKLMRRDAEHHPISVKALALGLPATSWQTISWREGNAGALTSRFARIRVRAAHRDEWRAGPRDEEWLLIEWPEGEATPAKYWLATVPPDMPFDRLVDLAKLRWRIERDYQELKQELGLGHYEGRGWRGFHHHATLCIAAYAFLIAERARISPSAASKTADKFAAFDVPQNRSPRGAARPPQTTCRKLDRDDAPASDRRPRSHPDAMSLLQRTANPPAPIDCYDAVRLYFCPEISINSAWRR